MIDFQSIAATATALSAAKELAQAAMATRDFNQFAGTVAEINAKLIDAQNGLLQAHASLSQLQQEHLICVEELTSLKKTVAQLGDHELVRLSDGVFVYVGKNYVEPFVNGSPAVRGNVPCVCQPCLEGGRKRVLVKRASGLEFSLVCPGCRTEFPTGEYREIGI